MNCHTCQSELEELLYGELSTLRQMAINEHLAGCAACRTALAALERENELFAQYYEQTAIDPSDAMWQAIHGRLQDEAKPSPARTWQETLHGFFVSLLAPAMLRQAGFAALLILLSVGLTALYFSSRKEGTQVAEIRPTPSIVPTATPSAALPPATPRPVESAKPQPTTNRVVKAEPKPAATPKLSEDAAVTLQIAKATHEYQSAIKLLERAIAKRKPELDDTAVRQFESSLAMIDASIAASRQAMKAHPNDPTTARYLLAAYSKKVELMQEIAMR